MTAPDINETLRKHRNELAQKIHEQCDTIEAAAERVETLTVKDAVDQIHALADLLADIVIEPGLDDMARRLDQYAVELAENNEYDGARLVIETAEAFGRRHAQLTSTAAADQSFHYHFSEAQSYARHLDRDRWVRTNLQLAATERKAFVPR